MAPVSLAVERSILVVSSLRSPLFVSKGEFNTRELSISSIKLQLTVCIGWSS
jgi:hypothetical protein